MYRVRAADGTEHGPLSVETVRAWLADGRVLHRSAARLEEGTEWKPLSEFPDFALSSGSVSAPSLPPSAAQRPPPALPPPLPPIARSSPQASPPRARFSALAIASLVLGLFGFLVIPALVGLVCGFVGLSKIRSSRGALKGRMLATMGILLSFAMLVLVGMGVFWAVSQHPQHRPGRPAVRSTGCEENLNQLAHAVRQYANDHGDIFPGATNWCDQVREYVPSMDVYTCPGASSDQRSSFALNRNVAGRNQETLNPATVLLFESTVGWNAAGTPEIAGSARGFLLVALVNGELVRIAPEGVSSLRWEP
jgi:hypothetical protein